MPAKMGLAAGIRRSAPSPIPTRPPSNYAELAVVQVRRNSDTFSPQAWRGDEGARWGSEGFPRTIGTCNGSNGEAQCDYTPTA